MLFGCAFAGTATASGQSRFQGIYAQNDERHRGNQDRRDGGERQSYRYDSNERSERQAGRLSPDERRALRRQIDEAGRDIYAPRR